VVHLEVIFVVSAVAVRINNELGKFLFAILALNLQGWEDLAGYFDKTIIRQDLVITRFRLIGDEYCADTFYTTNN
jgi:hypothetical protein